MAELAENDGFHAAQVAIDREGFLATVVGILNDTLTETVGPQEAEGFVNLVGMAISEQVLSRYLAAAGVPRLDLAATVDALVDWKRRLGGDFKVLEWTNRRVVLVNRQCPFTELTSNPGPMCRITSHVFGHMVADSQGYGRVSLAKTIARGSRGCRIVIDLDPEARDGGGQSYYARDNL